MSTELEIKIRTLLEGQGIRVADDQLKGLVASQERAAASAGGTGKAAKDAGDAIQQFGRRGSEAKDAFEGLSTVARGGEGAIFGLAKAWRALTTAFAANPITATLAVILGLLPLIQKGFDAMVASAQKSLDKMAGTGEQVRAVEKNIKELEETSRKSIGAATEDAKQLASAYAQVSSEIEGTLRRFKEVESAKLKAESSKLELDRKTALAGAKSPEEAAKINASFDARAAGLQSSSNKRVGDAELTALTQRGIEAKTTRDKAQAAIGEAEANLAKARAAEDEAKGSPIAAGNALRTRQAAEKVLKEVRDRYEPQLRKAESDLADVDASTKAFEYREQTDRTDAKLGRVTRASDSFDQAGGRTRIAELRREAQAAFDRGDNEGQDRAVAELRKLSASAKNLSKAISESASSTSAALDSATRDTKKLERSIANTKESSGGQ